MSLDYCIYEVKIGEKERQKRSEIEEGKEIIKVDITLHRDITLDQQPCTGHTVFLHLIL